MRARGPARVAMGKGRLQQIERDPRLTHELYPNDTRVSTSGAAPGSKSS